MTAAGAAVTGTESLRVRVTGRVQGVGFRAWTRDQARARGLSGWVRNEPDGAVAALVSGPAERVREMVAAMSGGPALARVDRVETGPAAPPEGPGFRVLR